MNLSPRQQQGCLILVPQGRIDQSHADAFSTALEPHLALCTPAGPALILDFSGVDYISSIGLRALMLAHRKVSVQQGRLAIAALTPLVHEVFAISHFNQVLKVYPGVSDALAALGVA